MKRCKAALRSCAHVSLKTSRRREERGEKREGERESREQKAKRREERGERRDVLPRGSRPA
jgi:hypothetical protein